MQLQKLEQYNDYKKDLFFWIKYYTIDRIVSLDKSKAKDDLDISELTYQINKKVSNIDKLALVGSKAHNQGITGISTYLNKIEKLYRYLITLDYQSIKDITDGTIRDYALKAHHKEREATKTALYKYARHFFNFIQEYNTVPDSDKPHIFNIGKDKDGKTIPLLRTRKKKEALKYLTTKQLKKLDESILTYPGCKNDADKTKTILVMRFFIYGGISVSEMIDLEFSDIVMLNDEDEDKNTLFEIEVGKGDKRRAIPMPKKRFIRYFNQHKELSQCNTIFFCSKNSNTKIARQTISKIVKEQLDYAKINIKDVSPEIFKNSFAIHLYKSGISDKKIQKLLGHKNLQTTRAILNAAKNTDRKITMADAFADFNK